MKLPFKVKESCLNVESIKPIKSTKNVDKLLVPVAVNAFNDETIDKMKVVTLKR